MMYDIAISVVCEGKSGMDGLLIKYKQYFTDYA